ncbi:MAG: hypothetical protein IKA87_07425, partial [Lentisphaeria bacterium]|nr:hypothetical protein [Lentisphaeria bacterium]
NSFSANGVTLNSASAPAQWTLNSTGNVSINNSVINDANSTTPIFLNGTNTTGGNISGNWAVFNAAGGVGDMYPSLNNPNFHALAGYVSNLEAEWGSTGRFDAFRRMPTSRQPIAVGDMSDLVMLNNFGSYDMIDFDSEFFGNGDGIGLLDEEEAREVLTDSAPADLGDLRALIEEK